MRPLSRLTLLLCIGGLLAGCASGVQVSATEYQKEKTFESEKSQDELYVAINDWLSQSLRSRKAAVQFTDKEAGKISARITTQGVSCRLDTSHLVANWTIDIKDHAYRLRVNPLHATSEMLNAQFSEMKEGCMQKLDKEVEATIASLEQHVSDYTSF